MNPFKDEKEFFDLTRRGNVILLEYPNLNLLKVRSEELKTLGCKFIEEYNLLDINYQKIYVPREISEEVFGSYYGGYQFGFNLKIESSDYSIIQKHSYYLEDNGFLPVSLIYDNKNGAEQYFIKNKLIEISMYKKDISKYPQMWGAASYCLNCGKELKISNNLDTWKKVCIGWGPSFCIAKPYGLVFKCLHCRYEQWHHSCYDSNVKYMFS